MMKKHGIRPQAGRISILQEMLFIPWKIEELISWRFLNTSNPTGIIHFAIHAIE